MLENMSEEEKDGFARSVGSQAEELARDILHQSREAKSDFDRRAATVNEEVVSRNELAWDLFDAALYAGQQSAIFLLKRGEQAKDEDYSPVRDSLTLLQCAGVLILHDIRALLRAGLWAGASARWRALHEVSVTATIIAREGTAIARRYLDHGHVVQTRRLLEFHDAHGRGPVARDELDRRMVRVEAIEKKYETPTEPSFREAYGWAAPLMDWTKKGDKRQKPTFEALERRSGLAHLRLLVFSAHGLVHADSAGVVTNVLGEPGEWYLGPHSSHSETVARPTMISFAQLCAMVQGGFEEDFNTYSQFFVLQGLAIHRVAHWSAEEFLEPGSSTSTHAEESGTDG